VTINALDTIAVNKRELALQQSLSNGTGIPAGSTMAKPKSHNKFVGRKEIMGNRVNNNREK